MSRTVIQPSRSGLALIAVFSGVAMGLWMWLGVASIMAEDSLVCAIILPVSVIGACACGWFCLWALKKRATDEPAMIIDEVGIFDNISPGNAGRIKWRETDRVWLVGPRWFRVLCVMPQNVRPYMDAQDGARGALMKFNLSLLGAPVLIPVAALEMPCEDLWFRVSHLASAPPPWASAAT